MTMSGAGPSLRELVRERDWAATALGPAEQWSEALRTTVETCLGSRFPVIVFWGPELVQVYNDAYAPIIGAKHPGALGQTARECFPEIWDVIGPMLHSVLSTGEATWSDDLLLMLERKGFAEECYFTFSYSPAGGDPVEGVFCAVIETTRRVLGERRLDTLRDLSVRVAGARGVCEVLDAAVEVLGGEGADVPAGLVCLTDGQPAAERWWPATGVGGARDALLRAASAVTRVGGHLVEPWEGLAASYRPGLPAVAAYAIESPGGTGPSAVLAVDLNRKLDFDEAYSAFLGLVASTIGAALASARSYQEAEQRARSLEELDRAKTSFLGNVSHEFRTPLTLVLGPLHEYRSDPRLPEDARTGLTMAERNARRLLRLVNNLLDVARLEAGRMTATYVATDLASLTADLAGMFRSAAESAGLRLVVDCASLSKPVYVDREMWEQVVTNLCANAVKYTVTGSITVTLREAGGLARLEVRDTGVGIVQDEIPYIFDRFRRAGSSARMHEGAGIGLALVRELVALHGGEVEVTSTPGEGSAFAVSVPLGSSHLAASQVAPVPGVLPSGHRHDPGGMAEMLEAASGAGPQRPGPCATVGPGEGRGAMVYVVDDNPDMRSYLSTLLGRHWSVETFADADKALLRIEEAPPDIVVSDVMMTGTDGFAFLSRLRSRPVCADVPVVLLSARAGDEAIAEGLEAGADDYVVKPFAARTLLARVRSHLELASLRRDGAERAARYTAQLAFLATAAGEVVAAETLEEIAGVLELSARQVTGATECRLELAPAGLSVHDGRPGPGGEVVVPLAGRDGAGLGTVRLRTAPGTALGDEDRRLMEELARIAARRIEHLLHYQREHQMADTLQRSLLPRALPALPGVEMVARYRPASEAAAVGGDWYDALCLEDGRLVVVVGDVMGHDIGAAVSMGQLRHVLRAHAVEAAGPAQLCATVNRLLPVLGAGEMATAAVAFIEPGTGRLAFTSAGHLPPVLVGAGGARLLEVPACLPLGALDEADYLHVEATLEPGSTLVLYTDGLVERRGRSLHRCLADFAARCAALDVADLAPALDAVLEEMLEDHGGGDDVAVLAVRLGQHGRPLSGTLRQPVP